MSKEVKVQLSIPYDKVRQVMCMMTGKILQDEEIDSLVGNDIVYLKTHVLDEEEDEYESGEDIEQVISALILVQKIKEKEGVNTKKKSKFQERLDEMIKLRDNTIN